MLDKTEGCWPWSETLSVEDNAICQDRLTLLMDQLEQKKYNEGEKRKNVIDLFVFLLLILHVYLLSSEQIFLCFWRTFTFSIHPSQLPGSFDSLSFRLLNFIGTPSIKDTIARECRFYKIYFNIFSMEHRKPCKRKSALNQNLRYQIKCDFVGCWNIWTKK